ncbi:MAG: VWA domain-containing protein [Gammaproteobacteria bacterium]|nr:VWA domain-containing protein [Gammaproteobacteria bacterium]
MDFEQIELLYLIIPMVVLWFFIHHKKNNIEALFAPEVLEKISLNKDRITPKTRLKLLLLSIILIVLALSQPTLKKGEVKIKQHLSDLVVAIDMSKSMLANDIYPNRFEFAKNKLLHSLNKINGRRIAILGFTSQSFLVSPLTDDFSSLEFLIKNLRTDSINLKGTNILNLLQAANDLTGKTANKQILLLTDGGDGNFEEEIVYATKHNLQIFIFDTASVSGGSIRTKNGLLKDDNKNIVYVRENPNIKALATQTHGDYLKYALNNNDLSNFINTFNRHNSSKDIKINQKRQLFYYPLSLALMLLFFTFFSLPQKP